MWTGQSGLLPRFLLLWLLFPKTSVSREDTGRLNELSSASLPSLLCLNNTQIAVLPLLVSLALAWLTWGSRQMDRSIPVCLPVSILAKEAAGINRSLASRISLWSEQSQSPCQQRFDWFLTSWTSQLGFKGLDPWDMDIQAVGASGGRSWAWKDRWTFKIHGEHHWCCYTMQEEKASGEPSSLEVPVPREFLGNGRIPKNSQQRPAWCQVSSVSQQPFSNRYAFANWAISVGMNDQALCEMLFCSFFWLSHRLPFFLFLFIFYRSIITLQCCVSFCCTTWISFTYTYVPFLLDLSPTPPGHHRTPNTAPCAV